MFIHLLFELGDEILTLINLELLNPFLKQNYFLPERNGILHLFRSQFIKLPLF